MNQIFKWALSCAVLTLVATSTAMSDPIPGAPKPGPPTGVFCIQPTLVEDIGGGDTRIVFEMVNWTHDVADGLTLETQRGLGQTSAGITIASHGFTAENDWDFLLPPVPNPGDTVIYGQGTGTSIANIDLAGSPFLNPFNPALPDTGPNTRRGFELIVNGWGASERLVFDWTLNLPNLGPDPDSFDAGVWQLDRSSALYTPGSLVTLTTWEQPFRTLTNGFGPIDFANNPLDPALTDQNATTFNIPEPGSVLLLAIGLPLIGSRRRKASA